ncbi:hypothetical protein [Escherichia coli]|uniref:hypothetical protein n=1 Tax=Escherichia coli TaxID=562 RepID=UPI002222A93A|nr:hypothetical protein [Escherichia coli]UYW83869.1 hypothetical protein N8A72_07415 [Escherichia coli O125ac:K+:H10]
MSGDSGGQSKYPCSGSFYLTAIMYFEHEKKYTTELDVVFNGESVLPDISSNQEQLQTFMFSPVNEKYVVVGTYLFVKNIKLIETGTYDIIYRIFEDIDGNLSEVIDEKKCALISTTPNRDKE